ncbi:MAG TPA: PfkB family carbohydrate kinase, partial [Candidatus Limnocylindria bacterium]
ATAAVAIAALGASVALVAAVGDDEPGQALRAELTAAGVDCAHLDVVPGRTAESLVLVDRATVTRTIVHAPGAAPGPLGARARELCATAAWVHVDHVGYSLAVDVERGRLSVDAGNPVDGLELDGLALYAPTRAALEARYPGREPIDAVRAALDEGARRVAVTLAGGGAMAADATGAWRIAAHPVAVASTLGAGDVFHGALVASLAGGHPLADALRRANAAAALSCRSIDARSAIPNATELDAALAGAPLVEGIVLEGSR